MGFFLKLDIKLLHNAEKITNYVSENCYWYKANVFSLKLISSSP
jgi:hypothetical protein